MASINFEDYFPTSDKSYPPIAHAHTYDTVTFKSAVNFQGGSNTLSVFDVKAYGAKGNGTTDDTTAFNNTISACNTAGGGIVYVPPGNYVINNNIIMLSNVILQGAGFASRLIMGNNKNISVIGQQYVVIREIYMDMSLGSTLNSYTILLQSSYDVTVERCWLLNVFGFGVFLYNNSTTTEIDRIRVLNNRIIGKCNNDLVGGGPTSHLYPMGEVIIDGNFITHDSTLPGAGAYISCIDIVAMKKFVITNNVTHGRINCGGEATNHFDVIIANNSVNLPIGQTFTSISVFAADAGAVASASNITIANNTINAGHIFVQGQTSPAFRTQKVIIANNNIVGVKGQTDPDFNYGINLNYLQNVILEGNVVDGSHYGMYLNDIQEINASNNKLLNCDVTVTIGGALTQFSGVNNLGINPDFVYSGGSITGAVTLDRVNGLQQKFTLTGNVTFTINSGIITSNLLVLELTQDGTGSRTVTWPANFKKAGGSLTLTTTAGATDIINARWDGTNWVEISRALNVS